MKEIVDHIQCTEGSKTLFEKMFGVTQYESNKEAYEDCLQMHGASPFPKSQARILFKINDEENSKGLISDILVAQFKNPEDNNHLYKEWPQDIGNCIVDWEKWSLSDVLIKIFVFYGVTYECRIKVLLQLSKIEEWRPYVAGWIYSWFN